MELYGLTSLIAEIYDRCRTSQAIDAAFAALRAELEGDIQARMAEIERLLLEHFNADIHNLLHCQRERAETRLDRITRLFWKLTQFILHGKASFDNEKPAFQLKLPPLPQVQPGNYQLIRKGDAKQLPENARIYRLTHPLGEYVLEHGRTAGVPSATLHFSYAGQKPRISVEQLLGKHGGLQLSLLELDSFQHEEHLIFTAITDEGELLDQDACEKLFLLPARSDALSQAAPAALRGNVERRLDAALIEALEKRLHRASRNHTLFAVRWSLN
jgi:hypothetical protein